MAQLSSIAALMNGKLDVVAGNYPHAILNMMFAFVFMYGANTLLKEK